MPKPERIIEDKYQQKIHQCKTCFTVYDDRFGDTYQNIEAGIAFENLPKNYCCPICEEPKEKFVELDSELVVG